MQVSQASRDRKLWRRIDHEITQYSLFGSLGQFSVLLIALVAAGLPDVHPKLSMAFGVMLILLVVVRTYNYLNFDQMYGRGPLKWQRNYRILHYIQTFTWSSFNCTIINAYGLEPISFLTMLFSLGLTFTNVTLWAPYEKVNHVHMSLMIPPAVLAFVATNELYGIFIGLVITLFFYGIWKQSELIHHRFWMQVQSTHSAREALKNLQVEQKKAEENFMVDNVFLANLSREVRTPMNNVLGMLTLLGDTDLNAEQRRMQNIAFSAGENIITLIDEILDFSRIMSGRLVLDSVIFNIRRCVDETVNMLSHLAYSKEIELTCIYDLDIPLRVQGDPKRISQGISNIVTYMIDRASCSEMLIKINLSPRSSVEGELEIQIGCQSCQAEEWELKELKDLFERRINLQEFANLNLGLYISKGVAESMGGRVMVDYKEETGLQFCFTSKIILSTQQTYRSSIPKSFVKKRVLLINAEGGLRIGLHNELESWLMEVEDIVDSHKALQVLRNRARDGYPFDVVVLNMGLTYQGSFKLSSIIAEDPALSGVKQLILCALHQRGEMSTIAHDKKIDNGVFLTKPYTRGNLFYALSVLFDDQTSIHQFDAEQPFQMSDDLKPYRILLVEDNKVNQMVTKGILKRLGYGVRVVNDGKEALGLLEDKTFDLILMDCHLPFKDGFEVTREIRQRESEKSQHTAIIAVTASTYEGIEAKCYASGMDGYMAKPIDPEKLEATLKVFLESAPHQEGVIYTDAHKPLPEIPEEQKKNKKSGD